MPSSRSMVLSVNLLRHPDRGGVIPKTNGLAIDHVFHRLQRRQCGQLGWPQVRL